MSRVFLSYSHKDEAIAYSICQYFESKGLSCWFASRDIEAGRIWSTAIIDGISHSDAMILILSESSNVSEQVLREVENAITLGMPVMTFIIEEVHASGGMAYFLATTTYVKAQKKNLIEKRLKKLYKVTKQQIEHKKSEKTILIYRRLLKALRWVMILASVVVINYFLYALPGIWERYTTSKESGETPVVEVQVEPTVEEAEEEPVEEAIEVEEEPIVLPSIIGRPVDFVMTDLEALGLSYSVDYVESKEQIQLRVVDYAIDSADLTMDSTISLSVSLGYIGEVVTIPDKNLVRYIRNKVNKPEGPLTEGDLLRVRSLRLTSNDGVRNLDGVQYMEKLGEVYLEKVYVSNYSFLEGLQYVDRVELIGLNVGNEAIEAVGTMPNVVDLRLGHTSITDLRPMLGNPNLKGLYADSNPVYDISYFDQFDSVETLTVDPSAIDDVSILRGMDNLTYINNNNDIVHIDDFELWD